MIRLFLVMCLFLSSCASSRVLVRDCQKLEGIDLMNCEMVKKL